MRCASKSIKNATVDFLSSKLTKIGVHFLWVLITKLMIAGIAMLTVTLMIGCATMGEERAATDIQRLLDRQVRFHHDAFPRALDCADSAALAVVEVDGYQLAVHYVQAVVRAEFPADEAVDALVEVDDRVLGPP